MRFLIDNALRPQLADLLRAEGYDAVHVRAYGMHAAKDEEIVERAIEEDRIVVSADSDFSAILAAQEAERPSFILFREPDLMIGRDYCNLLLPALPVLDSELAAGCVAVFRRGRLRVRRLTVFGIDSNESLHSACLAVVPDDQSARLAKVERDSRS